MKNHGKMLAACSLWCTAALTGLLLMAGSAHADSNQNTLTVNSSDSSQTVNTVNNQDDNSQTLTLNQGSQNFTPVNNADQKTDDGYQDMIVPHYDQNHKNPYEDLLTPPHRPVTTDTSRGNRMDVASVPKNYHENQVWGVNVGSLDNVQTVDWSNGKTSLFVSGWHLAGNSNERPYRWLIIYDRTTGNEISRQQLAGAIVRNDVARAYPRFTNAAYAGFDAKFDLPAYVKGDKLALVARFSDDADNGEGNKTDYWMDFDYGNYAWLDHVDRHGDQLQLSGWHAARQAYGRAYHYIIVIDANNGQEYGRQEITDPIVRDDVARAHPHLLGSETSGFNTSVKLHGNYLGHTLRVVSRYTDNENGEPDSHSVDYYFNPLTMRNNTGWLDSWSVADGHLTASGWHAADAALTAPYHYLIVFDRTLGRQVASLKVANQASSDVAKVHANIYQSGQSRFQADFGKLPLVNGHQYALVSRYSNLDQGNGDGQGAVKTDYWFNLGQLDDQQKSWLDGSSLSNQELTVSGWAASSRTIGKPYLQLIAVDANGELGRTTVSTHARPDVGRVYPHIYNSANSGYQGTIKFSRAVKGQLRLVVRYTDLLNAYGPQHCVDFWHNL